MVNVELATLTRIFGRADRLSGLVKWIADEFLGEKFVCYSKYSLGFVYTSESVCVLFFLVVNVLFWFVNGRRENSFAVSFVVAFCGGEIRITTTTIITEAAVVVHWKRNIYRLGL